jgi:hypothetical protein
MENDLEKPSQDLVVIQQLATQVLAPLLEQSSRAQETAARIELDRFKLASEFQERQQLREFWIVALALGALVAMGTALVLAAQYQQAFSVVAFITGIAAGYGFARARQRQ